MTRFDPIYGERPQEVRDSQEARPPVQPDDEDDDAVEDRSGQYAR